MVRRGKTIVEIKKGKMHMEAAEQSGFLLSSVCIILRLLSSATSISRTTLESPDYADPRHEILPYLRNEIVLPLRILTTSLRASTLKIKHHYPDERNEKQ